jgi:acetyl-CoA carboxylase carboxyl transferase subunit alpha
LSVAFLAFEKPVGALLAGLDAARDPGEADELRKRAERQLADLYARLTPWQRVEVARHPDRPHLAAFLDGLVTDFMPLGGDRRFAEDRAIVGGPARRRGRPVMILGQAKGETTEGRIAHNFGMARPEGYRKAARLLAMADRFGLPVITLVDTPGAFPGIDAEERGQAEAIARATAACLRLSVPMISIVTGEGGSGGAVALAAGNRVLMLEHAVYSVISPEGCASILWRDGAGRAADAADALRITAADLIRLGVIDRIVYEPVGGAHRHPAETVARVGTAIDAELAALDGLSPEELRRSRRARYRGLAGLTG